MSGCGGAKQGNQRPLPKVNRPTNQGRTPVSSKINASNWGSGNFGTPKVKLNLSGKRK